MDYNKQFAHRRLMVLMDLVTVVFSMLLAGVVHSALRDHFSVFKDPPSLDQFMLIAVLTMPLMLSLVAVLGLHRQFEQPFKQWVVVWKLLQLHAASLVGISLIVFLTQVPLNRSVVGLFLTFTFTMMWLSRILLDGWWRRSHATGRRRSHLLIVGNDPKLITIVVRAALTDHLVPEIVGVIDIGEECGGIGIGGVRVLGNLHDLSRVLHDQTIDEVVLATRSLSSQQFETILAACDDLGTPMRQLVLPDFHDGRRLGLDRQFGLPFVTLVRTVRSTEALALKRVIDLAIAAVALLALSPVLLLIALLIVFTMGRPVLHSQERIGYHGRRFHMHKFRSMVRNAERQRDNLVHRNEMSGPVFKIADDPRITPLGRVLRRYSFDELPQLFDVLNGSMSLVGPRPLPVAEQQQISGPMRRRLSMKPGITGLWQVSGRSNLSFDEWMQMDLEYLDNWSNLFDLKLLALTIPAVLVGRGAR
jgi:exopolysaccharide biosynthesis polyprenyl glycosylphosphotransferase